ncbi:MAG TPA: CopD family protein [Bacilli bacterium]
MAIVVLACLYLSLSLCVALSVGPLMPKHKLPIVKIPRGLAQIAAGGAILCSIGSLLVTSAGIARSFTLPLGQTFLQMLYTTLQGRGVLGVLLCGAVWFGADALLRGRRRDLFALAASVGFVLFAALAMHAATLSASAYVAQAAHLVAVTFWLGFLFLVGWFAVPDATWRPFLAWYTPAAITCVAVVAVSGVTLMNDLSNDWLNSLVLDYGQVLLLKHLLIIPLLAFASVNGFLIRRRLNRSARFDPRHWIRAESLLALAIFTVTALLSRQTPPHDLRQTLRYTPPSQWFLRIYNGTVTPDIQLAFALRPLSIVFILAACAFLAMTYVVFRRRLRPSLALFTSLLFVASAYIAVAAAIE